MEFVKGVQEESPQLKVIFHEIVNAHYTHFKKINESSFLQSKSSDFSQKNI
jgi:hypothetical protein